MPYTTLVDTGTLSQHLTDPLWAIVDCRFMLADAAWGGREYLTGHIPGAVYAHLESDLSGPLSGRNGRHPLPDAVALQRTLGRLGIGKGVQVVAYDQDNGMFAGRLWWLLRWLGHEEAAVLDGGFAKWIAEARPIVAGQETRPLRSFSGVPSRDMTVDAAEVERLRNDPAARLIDVRAPERYRGEIEPIDRVPGHIPGAVNDHFMQNVDERGVFRDPDSLRDRLTAALGGVAPENAVCYCGSGVTACNTLLALELAGLHGVRLYPGSWSEWASDPSRPVAPVAKSATSADAVQEKGPAM